MRKLAVRTLSALAVGSGWTRRRRRRRLARGEARVFVLEYHDVVAGGGESEGTVSASRFRRHLAYLKGRYRLATVERAAELLAAPNELTPSELTHDVAAVTFDDGYAGNHEAAFPELRAAGAPATVYLTTGFLDGEGLWFDFARRALAAARQARGTSATRLAAALPAALPGWTPAARVEPLMRRLKYAPPAERQRALDALAAADLELAAPARPMSWEAARELLAGGVELGAHTVTHPILSTLAPTDQETEIRTSRARIAEMTGREPATFAYPNGSLRDYDRQTVEIVARCGFTAACTTRRGTNRPGCEPFELRRLGVGSDPIYVLEARLAGLFDEEVRRLLRLRA